MRSPSAGDSVHTFHLGSSYSCTVMLCDAGWGKPLKAETIRVEWRGQKTQNFKYIMMKITLKDLPDSLVQVICSSGTAECLDWLQTKHSAKRSQH